jgi:hypothetical protein
VEKKFGLLLGCANLHLQCTARFFYSRRTPPSFLLVPQQMAAVNLVHFYCVKFCVQIDRKIISNIKIKKYRTVNKRSTNSLCAFLTFLTVINKLISIIILNAEICFE